ncbi:B12-binding domain-containing radical SAM protein [Acetivibrio ethanolgignens]|uniref:Radical SAM protein n=1 Tax=Acetivibrio ethanolgignens TaxID=290052 RepID=A0A0V8QBD4_9FIRM|nr:B12-binding domain-containing radical SAM protein [Acetivibrio ethanolgignens]KSV57893.1 radical SAM protein [Acetivibrio ethanolgignens]
MKVLLTAVNAKYIHSNLAVYSLCSYAANQGESVEYAEYTINHQEEDILAGIYKKKPEIIAFSCYIWNIAIIDRVAAELKKVLPECEIWYGGPEVSYNPLEQLDKKPFLSGVMVGEGEETLTELLKVWKQGGSLEAVKGIAFRRTLENSITEPFFTGVRKPLPLDEIPFPYKSLKNLENRIVYYESSRGCPYSCSYCLSSVEKGIRLRSLSLVKEELSFFIGNRVPQVKFIDRTFNCNHAHAMAIWQFIKEKDKGVTNFHFEISADLLKEEEITFLNTLRPGLVQLEIGVQSIHGETIQAINRVMDLDKLAFAVQGVKKGKNIHQHLDLIAGLPYEDIKTFQKSFDFVYRLKPEQLQLGFLKVLKGARMEKEAKEYGLIYQSRPPFEVLQTKWLSYDDVLTLKQIEEMVEIYYNSGQFEASLGFLEHYYPSPYSFFGELGAYYEEKGLYQVNHKRVARYEILLDFIREKKPELSGTMAELLTYDLYIRENLKSRPAFMKDMGEHKEELRKILEEESQKPKLLSGYEGIQPGQLGRMVHGEWFAFNIEEAVRTGKPGTKGQWLLFDYQKRNPLNHQAFVICAKVAEA